MVKYQELYNDEVDKEAMVKLRASTHRFVGCKIIGRMRCSGTGTAASKNYVATNPSQFFILLWVWWYGFWIFRYNPVDSARRTPPSVHPPVGPAALSLVGRYPSTFGTTAARSTWCMLRPLWFTLNASMRDCPLRTIVLCLTR